MRRVVLRQWRQPSAPPAVVVVGGGASGYFAAITAARRGAETILVEATRGAPFVLASGGGRCNVITTRRWPSRTSSAAARAGACCEIRGPHVLLFGPDDMRRWFEAEGVELKAEADGRVFPVTDDSQTVADALRNAAQKAGVSFRGGAAARDH